MGKNSQKEWQRSGKGFIFCLYLFFFFFSYSSLSYLFLRLLSMRFYVVAIYFLMFFNINRTCFSYIKVM